MKEPRMTIIHMKKTAGVPSQNKAFQPLLCRCLYPVSFNGEHFLHNIIIQIFEHRSKVCSFCKILVKHC